MLLGGEALLGSQFGEFGLEAEAGGLNLRHIIDLVTLIHPELVLVDSRLVLEIRLTGGRRVVVVRPFAAHVVMFLGLLLEVVDVLICWRRDVLVLLLILILRVTLTLIRLLRIPLVPIVKVSIRQGATFIQIFWTSIVLSIC